MALVKGALTPVPRGKGKSPATRTLVAAAQPFVVFTPTAIKFNEMKFSPSWVFDIIKRGRDTTKRKSVQIGRYFEVGILI